MRYGRELGTIALGVFAGAVVFQTFAAKAPAADESSLTKPRAQNVLKNTASENSLRANFEAPLQRTGPELEPGNSAEPSSELRPDGRPPEARRPATSSGPDALTLLSFRREALEGLRAKQFSERHRLINFFEPKPSDAEGARQLLQSYHNRALRDQPFRALANFRGLSSYEIEINANFSADFQIIPGEIEVYTPNIFNLRRFSLTIRPHADQTAHQLGVRSIYFDPQRQKHLAYFSSSACAPLVSAFFQAFLFELPQQDGEDLALWALPTGQSKWRSADDRSKWGALAASSTSQTTQECAE